MDDIVRYYEALYSTSPEGSPQEHAALDVLCVCDGKLSMDGLREKLAESRAVIAMEWMAGSLVIGNGQCLLLGEYHRQKVELYQQFFAMVGSPLA